MSAKRLNTKNKQIPTQKGYICFYYLSLHLQQQKKILSTKQPEPQKKHHQKSFPLFLSIHKQIKNQKITHFENLSSISARNKNMSLNCLACHILQRSNSDIDSNITENFIIPGYKNMGRKRPTLPVVRRVKTGHRRLHSAEAIVCGDLDEPKLVRSSGIRRDWSFEDLKKQRDQIRIVDTIKE